jgi:hypothetical protein
MSENGLTSPQNWKRPMGKEYRSQDGGTKSILEFVQETFDSILSHFVSLTGEKIIYRKRRKREEGK